MAPEMMWVDAKMHSPKQVEQIRRYYPKIKPEAMESRKLLCTLLDKKHYICFSENLFFYLSRGMRLQKVRPYLILNSTITYIQYM